LGCHEVVKEVLAMQELAITAINLGLPSQRIIVVWDQARVSSSCLIVLNISQILAAAELVGLTMPDSKPQCANLQRIRILPPCVAARERAGFIGTLARQRDRRQGFRGNRDIFLIIEQLADLLAFPTRKRPRIAA